MLLEVDDGLAVDLDSLVECVGAGEEVLREHTHSRSDFKDLVALQGVDYPSCDALVSQEMLAERLLCANFHLWLALSCKDNELLVDGEEESRDLNHTNYL